MTSQPFIRETTPVSRAYLLTHEVAAVIGSTTDYVRQEIYDGRLEAELTPRPARPGRQKGYRAIRIYPEPFRRYLRRYYPRVQWGGPAAAARR